MVTDLAALALGGGDAGLAQAGHAVTLPLPLHVSGAAVTRALSGHVCCQLLFQRGYSHAHPGLRTIVIALTHSRPQTIHLELN